MALYTTRVMPPMRGKYQAYMDGLSEGKEAQGFWKFTMEELKWMLDDEEEEVKAEVEEYLQKHLASQLPAELNPEQLLLDGIEEAQKIVQGV